MENNQEGNVLDLIVHYYYDRQRRTNFPSREDYVRRIFSCNKLVNDESSCKIFRPGEV